jgi:GNAT superfamily N-acetyltransferase
VIGQRLHAYLRAAAGYERIQVGPFLATFTPGSVHPNLNYAVPDDGIEPSPEQIAALVALYDSRGLRPRLEYASSAAPALAPALLTAGFTAEARLPLLTCQPGQPRRVHLSGIAVSDAADERDHEDAMRVAAVAYGEPVVSNPGEAVAARLAMMSSGGAVAIARDTTTAEAIGSGLYPVPVDAVTELAAVGTLPSHCHRGVATAVMSHLADRALRRGANLVWLTAEHDAENHAAQEAGFRDTGETMVHISRSIDGRRSC